MGFFAAAAGVLATRDEIRITLAPGETPEKVAALMDGCTVVLEERRQTTVCFMYLVGGGVRLVYL